MPYTIRWRLYPYLLKHVPRIFSAYSLNKILNEEGDDQRNEDDEGRDVQDHVNHSSSCLNSEK